MTPSELIALGALIVSMAALILSIVLAKNDNKISKVELEQAFINTIKDARYRYSQMAETVLNVDPDDKKKDIYTGLLNERIEEYLNSLDYACGKYLSGVLDKTSFVDNFQRIVLDAQDNIKLFENATYGDSNRFVSLKRVYKDLSESK